MRCDAQRAMLDATSSKPSSTPQTKRAIEQKPRFGNRPTTPVLRGTLPPSPCAPPPPPRASSAPLTLLAVPQAGVTSDGGHTFALNVIPTEARAGFDIRVSPSMDPADMQARLTEWTEAEGVSWDYAHWTAPLLKHHLTSTDRTKNAWWGVLEDAVTAAGFTLEPEIFPGCVLVLVMK